jgi:PAS domain S-box-containing protein
MNLLISWFSSKGVLPHGFCYQWDPWLVWLHATSDGLIAAAYFLISAELFRFSVARRDLPLRHLYYWFALFIAACGASNAVEIFTLWVPAYWLSGAVKVITASVSVPTAVMVVRSMPQALNLPNAQALRAANEELELQGRILKESEVRFRRMADNIQEIFWTMNPQTMEVTYVSPAYEEICERSCESLYASPTSYRELIHPEDRGRVLAGLGELARTNLLDEEFRIVCPSGMVKWVRAIGFNAKNEEGVVETFVGTVQEITARKKMESALRESEDLFRDLVEHSSDLICTHDLSGRMLSVNELPVRVLGYAKEELLNKPMRDFLPPEAREQFDASLLEIEKKGFVKGRMVVLSKTGERRIWEFHNTLRTDGNHGPIVRGVAHDVTEKVRAEQALRLSEEKFSKAFLASPHAIVISKIEDGTLMDVNDSFHRIMKFSREESIGRTSHELGIWTSESDRDEIIREIKESGRVRSKEFVFQTKEGKRIIVDYSAEVIQIGGQGRLLSVCEDITQRKAAENELRRVSGQLLRLQDEERRKIARDLHDSTGQDLVALTTTLSQLRDAIPASNRKLRGLVQQCQTVSDRSLREIRTVSYLLHPPLLDEAGLEDAIRHFADGYEERTGISVNIQVSANFGRHSQEIELGLFRVVQESLTNIQRHSGSSTARIDLVRDAQSICLTVKDAGKGMTLSGHKQNGMGLVQAGVGIPSMEERVKQVGGRLQVESGGEGTTVRVSVPIHA